MAPFVAGSSRMPAGRFIPATFIASGLWSATFSLLGYVFWQSFDRAAELAREGTLVVAVLVLVTSAWSSSAAGGANAAGRWVSPPIRTRLASGSIRTGTWPGANPTTAKENS